MKKIMAFISIYIIVLGFCFIETEKPYYEKRYHCDITLAYELENSSDLVHANQCRGEDSAFVSYQPNFLSCENKSKHNQSATSCFAESNCNQSATSSFAESNCNLSATSCFAESNCNQSATLCFAEASKDIFDMLNPELIDFYETYFAKQKIITGVKPQKLERLAQTHGISKNKLIVLLALQNIAQKNGEHLTITLLCEKSNAELFKIGKSHFEANWGSLTDEERDAINKKLDELKKQNFIPKV